MGVNLECPGGLTLGSWLLDGDCFHGRQNPSNPAPLSSPSLGEEASIGRRYWVGLISSDQGPELRAGNAQFLIKMGE